MEEDPRPATTLDDATPLNANARNSFTGLVGDWARTLAEKASENAQTEPNYYVKDPFGLVTTSYLHSFQVGAGDSIFAETLTRIQNAEFEVIFITCFWAKSSSLEKLCKSLKVLSRKSHQAMATGTPKIRVRIGFSSLSACQKVCHPNSLEGRVYRPSEWQQKLGLPPPEDLSGLDLEIKSVFVKPVSVMHPKFVCVDRKLVFLPSCNVSWEDWFEGCLTLSGPVVINFVEFWYRFWARETGGLPAIGSKPGEGDPAANLFRRLSVVQEVPSWLSYLNTTIGDAVPTVFLPSPHHVNPHFQPIPFLSAPRPPPTPLNVFLWKMFERAKFSIYMQTPNITCPSVLKALLEALARGVDVHIVTSERLMVLEQLGTAGTTTSSEIKKLVKKYKKLPLETPIYDTERDPPGHPPLRGRLHVEYYQPGNNTEKGEPVQSHLKLTIVDEEFVVLGSGNMDRASWYTSQELGIAFWSTELAAEIHGLVTRNLQGRLKLHFPQPN